MLLGDAQVAIWAATLPQLLQTPSGETEQKCLLGVREMAEGCAKGCDRQRLPGWPEMVALPHAAP